jgi:methionyl-tRNA formyltransferase
LAGDKINVYRAECAQLTEDETAAFEGAQLGEVLSDKAKRGLLVKCADGALKITEIQAPGGKRVSGSEFLNGRKVQKGQVFEC